MSVKIAQADGSAARADWRPAPASAVRRLPASRLIVREWRRLTGGGARTLVGCSGGADSTALALALASATRELAIGHVAHDLRPPADAQADLDAVRGLAAAVGLPVVESSVQVASEAGNAEAAARRARYAALAGLARQAEAPFIAVAHHADDQLETLTMALMRGAGLDGLGGARERRGLGKGATLIRPMLGVKRSEAEAICAAAGTVWREDATNADASRLRAFLRQGPLAEIGRRQPAAALRAARTARICHEAAALVRERAREVFGEGLEWRRDSLARERDIVIAAGVREAFGRVSGGAGLDRLTGRLLDDICAALCDGVGGERRFALPAGARLSVDGNIVRLSRVDHEA